jgi:hypothetical protein
MATETLAQKKLQQKQIGIKIQTLSSMVDSLGDSKTNSSKRSQEMWKERSKKAKALIAELRKKGVKEYTHPKFQNAIIVYKYWAYKGK